MRSITIPVRNTREWVNKRVQKVSSLLSIRIAINTREDLEVEITYYAKSPDSNPALGYRTGNFRIIVSEKNTLFRVICVRNLWVARI